MIGNFLIRSGASLPWLEAIITKSGQLTLPSVASSGGCGNAKNPDAVDLTDAQSIAFKLYKCGRVPAQVGLAGQAEIDTNDKTSGLVRYKWNPQDTLVPGIYYGSFEITFNDNTLFKWPMQLEALTIEIL